MANFSFRYKFEPICFWLKVIGLWPNDATYKLNIYTFYSVICVPLFMIANTFFQTMKLFMAEFDLNALAGAVFVAAHLMAIMKVSMLMRKLPIINKLLSTLDDRDLQPTSEDQIKIAEVDFKLYAILYKTFQAGASVATIALSLGPLVDGSYQKYSLPLFAWYPFSTTTAPYYQIVYCYQIVGLIYIVNAQLNLDALSVGFTVYICTQCDILSDKLKLMKNFIDLQRCVEHHRKILEFFSDFGNFFCYIIFVQLFLSAMTLALVLFKLSMTVPGTADYYTLMVIAFIVPLENYLYCWFGNEVELRSSNISVAIFESDWVGTSAKFQKLLLIFAMNAQKPMTLTAFNLFPLSLRTFMSIMKTSWSYFVVLNQLNTV